MQVHRKSVVAAVLLSLALSGAATALPSRDDGRDIPHNREVRKTEKPPTSPWLGIVITVLDWLSIPPG